MCFIINRSDILRFVKSTFDVAYIVLGRVSIAHGERLQQMEDNYWVFIEYLDIVQAYCEKYGGE